MHETFINHIDGADTVVLFIHGFLGSTEHFERFITLLPDNVSVYNVLLEGHGAGVRDFARASMAKWKAQIEEITDELSRRYSKMYIAAHSMGTFFAMEAAIRHPDNVKGIFLLQTPLKIGLKPAAAINTVKSFFNLKDETSKAYKNAHSVKLTLKFWQYIGWIPRYLELFKESKKSRKTILELKTPCLIFQSKKDELVSMESLKYIPDSGNITQNVLENSAHFIYHPEDMAHMENEFIRMIK